MYRLAILLIVILIVVRVMYKEKYTRALHDSYVPTRNSKRVAGVFSRCSPGSCACDKTVYPVDGLPLA